MTRIAEVGTAEWRRWKHQHHWAGSGAAVDPLGAGNTALIASLGVTPLAFYDVRKNLAVASGTASSLADVSGVGTYGPALNQATQAAQPTWDGTTLNFDGSTFLLSASAVSGLDLSLALTAVLIADVSATTVGQVGVSVGAAAAGAPNWHVTIVGTGSKFHSSSDKNGASGATSAASTGTGAIRSLLSVINAGGGTTIVSVEVPSTAKAVSGSGTGAEASGSQLIAIGAKTSGTGGGGLRFRALLIWQGVYTTGQRDTLKTYATTYHGAVLA